jgi:hypothetical protein
MFNTPAVLARYPRLRDVWADKYDLFTRVTAEIASVSPEKWERRKAAILQAAADRDKDPNKSRVCIVIPERDAPERSAADLFAIARLVRKQEDARVKLLLSGGVSLGVGNDGVTYDRQKTCGEHDACTMARVFRTMDRDQLIDWDCDVMSDTASQHTGDQCEIIVPSLLAWGVRLAVVVCPVEHLPRFASKLSMALRHYQRGWPNTPRVRDVAMRIVCIPVFPLDGRGWDGLIGRGVTAAEDAFAESREARALPSGVKFVDHSICDELGVKSAKETYGKRSGGGWIDPPDYPVPNMPFEDMLADDIWQVELGHLPDHSRR